MPRPHRLQVAGGIFHLITRGNCKQAIYLDDTDRRLFLRLLGTVVEAQGWRCLAYCLMGNHYHLLVQTPELNLSDGMEWLNGGYARVFNFRHDRLDHLFGRRFFSELIEDDAHLWEVARYIVLNPVRARLLRQPENWQWSSYCATAGMTRAARFLDVAGLLSYFNQDLRRARARYVSFVDAGMEELLEVSV